MTTAQKRIKMILPVPVPPEALAMFAAQLPEHLRRPDIDVVFTGTRGGARLLDSAYERTLADAFVLEAGAGAEDEGYAAVCINSMSDSALPALRSRLTIPVVGPAQTCYLLACDLGRRFSVVTMWDRWKPLTEKVITEHGLGHRLASVRSIGVRPDAQALLSGKEDSVFPALLSAAQACIEEDGADVIILGSTTMHQSHAFLADALDVPVLNPGLVAYKMCEMLLDLGLSHSRRAYIGPETLNDRALQMTGDMSGPMSGPMSGTGQH